MGTSATGGYLLPTNSLSLEDSLLSAFFQQVIVGVTGIPGKFVRPRFQPEPANFPGGDVDWIAFGESGRTRDTFATVFHENAGEGSDLAYRNEIISFLCSFYGPHARATSELLEMGLSIAQNREVMTTNGYGLVDVGDPVVASDSFQGKWVQRFDLTVRVRRAQGYRYPVLNVLGAPGTVTVDPGGLSLNFSSGVTNHAPSQLPLFGFGLDTSTVSGWGKGSWQ